MTRTRLYELSKITAHWFARAIQLQLFLTLFSLPILAAWAIPFSIMSPVGNIIFTPFLILFLLLSSFIFFGELLHAPYGFCTLLLNHLTTFWMKLMDFGAIEWLTGITYIPLPLLSCIAIAPIFIMSCKHTRSLPRSICCFLLLLIGIVGYTRFNNQKYRIFTIPCARGQLTLITTPTTTLIVDPGFLGSMTSAASWTRYTLIPELIKNGITTINHVVILQPKGFAFESLEQLCCLLRVEHVWLPYWCGTMRSSHIIRYKNLIKTLQITGTQLVRIPNDKKINLCDSSDQTITLSAEPRNIKLGSIAYCALKCDVQIDNNRVTLYSSN